jgi:hypothetical protein
MPRQRTPRQIQRAPLSLPRVMDPFAAPKRKRDYESGADVLSSTLSRLENDAASVTAAAAARPFVAAATWAGARPGYVFGRGAQGQGYYADRGGGSTSAAAPAPAAEVRRVRESRVFVYGCAADCLPAAPAASHWRGVARAMRRSACARRGLLRSTQAHASNRC